MNEILAPIIVICALLGIFALVIWAIWGLEKEYNEEFQNLMNSSRELGRMEAEYKQKKSEEAREG